MTDLSLLVEELAENDSERALIRGALRALAYAAPTTAAPEDLRARLTKRIKDESRGTVFTEGPSLFARADRMEWTPYAAGVDVKILFHDPATGAQTVLVRIEPNTPFPPHEHHGIEDLYLLEGEAWVGDVEMRAGDYCRAPSGSEHNDVRSGALGATSLVVTR